MDLDQEAVNVNRIEFLQGYNVKCVTAGSDFTVALVVRNDERISTDDNKSINENNPVKNSCPLGLPILENEYDDMTEADDKVKIDPLRYEKLVTDTAKTWPELFSPLHFHGFTQILCHMANGHIWWFIKVELVLERTIVK